MFPIVNIVPEAAGGGEWLTSITIRNPSGTAAVQGAVNFFTSNGTPMPAAVVDPNVSFLVPASGSTTISTHNKGPFIGGFAKVFSNGNVNVESSYIHSAFAPNTSTTTTVTARSTYRRPTSYPATPPSRRRSACFCGGSSFLRAHPHHQT